MSDLNFPFSFSNLIEFAGISMATLTRATFADVKKNGASIEPVILPAWLPVAWFSNSRSMGFPASRSTGFTLQYPLRERTIVLLSSTFTLIVWQLPSFESGGV